MRKGKFTRTIRIYLKTIGLMWDSSRFPLISLVVLSIMSGLVQPATMTITKNFLDALASSITQGAIGDGMIPSLCLLFAISIIGTILNTINTYTKENLSDRMSLHVNTLILDKCVKLPMSSYDNEKTYNKIQMATEQTPQRCVILVDIITSIISVLVQLFGVLWLVLSFNNVIFFVCLVSSIPLFLLRRYTSRFFFRLYESRMEKLRLSETLKNIILKNENIKEVKLFGISSYLKNLILQQETKFNKENKTNRKKFSLLNVITIFFSDIVNLGIKLWIIFYAIANRSTIGSINLYLSSVDTIKTSIESMLTQFSSAYEQTLYIDSLFEILNYPIQEDEGLVELQGDIESILFENVSFTYPGTEKKVLDNITFELKKDTTYALVGLNGSGKTTIIKLLLNLYQPQTGNIYINGINISKIKEQSLWEHISAVFQDFIRYPVSIGDNIAFGMLSKKGIQKSIIEAARYSGANEFIEKMPEGYNTQMQREWSGGVELSQGQWQKVAISRCVIRHTDIMIYDEPFSSLDALSEKIILDNLKKTKANRICLFVTHRYSSLSLADQLIVIKDGSIVECGSHQSLMRNSAYYSELFKAQAEPFYDLDKPKSRIVDDVICSVV